jgi:transcriptional regulator with XRE-family HTH domain
MRERKPPNKEQLECARRANKLWQAKKRKEKMSQASAADELGISASGFNQYINGRIALNTDIVAALASFFGVSPREIDPGWLALGGDTETLDAEFERLSLLTTEQQDFAAIKSMSDRVSPADAMKYALLFLERAKSGL